MRRKGCVHSDDRVCEDCLSFFPFTSGFERGICGSLLEEEILFWKLYCCGLCVFIELLQVIPFFIFFINYKEFCNLSYRNIRKVFIICEV